MMKKPILRIFLLACLLFITFSFLSLKCLSENVASLRISMPIYNNSGDPFTVRVYDEDGDPHDWYDEQTTIEHGKNSDISLESGCYLVLEDQKFDLVFCWKKEDGTYTRKLYYRKEGYNIHCGNGKWISKDSDCNE